MKNRMTAVLVVILGVVLLIVDLQPAYAQEDDDSFFVLEEIVVVSQKREQEVQDVPIAITVVGEEQLQRQKIYSIQDLAVATPGLEFGDTGASPGGGALIRGIGSTGFDNQVEPSAGIVVDGVPLGAINLGNMFDVERVEILRGPQGTLFGFSASAGIINIITASPEIGVFKGKVGFDATADGKLGSGYSRQEIRAMLNFPVTEDSAIRATANGNFIEGLRKNHYPGMDDQEIENTDLRVKYLYWPSNDFTANLIFEYSKRKNMGSFVHVIREIPQFSPDPGQFWLTDLYNHLRDNGGITLSDEDQAVYTSYDSLKDTEWYGLSAQFDWTMANHDFVSISSYKRWEETKNMQVFGYDWYPGLLEIQEEGKEQHTNTYSQELRVQAPADSKLDYLAGIFLNYYERIPDSLGTELILPPLPPFLPPPSTVPTENFRRVTAKNQNYAFFADANYPITDAFRILGGVRYSLFNLDIDMEDLASGLADNDSLEEDFFTWRAGLQYAPNDDMMLYTTVSRSVKSPIITEPPITDSNADWTFTDAEVPTSLEVGAKLTALNRKLAIDYNMFYTKIKDYQGIKSIYDEATTAVTWVASNIPEVISKGLELDIFGQPLAGLTLNMGYLYNIAEYPSEYGSLEGQQIMSAPKHKVTFSCEYSRPFTETLYGFVGFDTTYKSKIRVDTTISSASIYPAHWVSGARIGLSQADNKWSISLFGRNIFDEHVPVNQIEMTGMVYFIPTERTFRQVGVSIDYNF